MAFNSKAKKREYVNLKGNVGESAHIEKGALWLKNGKYETCGVSINLDDDYCLSDWMKMIQLENVDVAIEENDKGYPTLIIRGK